MSNKMYEMDCVTYEDVHERVAASVLFDTGILPYDEENSEPCVAYLAYNAPAKGRLAQQLVEMYKTWTGRGLHHCNLTLEALVVHGGRLHVTDWANAELCACECSTHCVDREAVVAIVREWNVCISNDTFPESHPAYQSKLVLSSIPDSIFPKTQHSISAIFKFCGLPPIAWTFIKSYSSPSQVLTIAAALLLSHKMYGKHGDYDLTPTMLHYMFEKAISPSSIVEQEKAFFASNKQIIF